MLYTSAIVEAKHRRKEIAFATFKLNLQFPSYSYARYNEEIIVTTSKDNLLFENSLYGLFDDLNMKGNIISVSPGDDPITSTYGGLIRVCTDGIVQITERI